jgi:hypothetical protein
LLAALIVASLQEPGTVVPSSVISDGNGRDHRAPFLPA